VDEVWILTYSILSISSLIYLFSKSYKSKCPFAFTLNDSEWWIYPKLRVSFHSWYCDPNTHFSTPRFSRISQFRIVPLYEKKISKTFISAHFPQLHLANTCRFLAMKAQRLVLLYSSSMRRHGTVCLRGTSDHLL